MKETAQILRGDLIYPKPLSHACEINTDKAGGHYCLPICKPQITAVSRQLETFVIRDFCEEH